MTSLNVARIPKRLSKLFSADSLTQKAYLNALAMLLDRGVRFSIGFFLNPYMVNSLGDYLFGAWQILSRMSTFFSAASGRPTQALTWVVASQQISDDYPQKRRTIGSALAVSAIFFPLLMVLGGILAWFTPALLDAPQELYWHLRLTTILLILNLAITDIADIPQSVLRGENLAYKRIGLSTILVLVGGGLTVFALYAGGGIAGMAAANIATTILTGLLFVRIVRQYVPWFGIARPAWAEVRRFFQLSGWFLVWFLVLQLIRMSDVVILGVMDSVETVTTYTLTKYIPETVITMIFIVVGSVTPGLGGIIGAGELKRAAAVRSEVMVLTWLITLGVGTSAIAWDQTFLGLWVDDGYYAGHITTLLIVIMVVQFVMIENDARIIDLTLDIRQKVITGIISAVISLGLASAMLYYLDAGILGLCIGFITGRLLLSVAYPIIVGRFLGVPLGQQVRGIIRPVIVMAIFFGLAVYLSRYVANVGVPAADSWIGLAFYAGSTFAVATAAAFVIGLSARQRQQIVSRLLRSMKSDA